MVTLSGIQQAGGINMSMMGQITRMVFLLVIMGAVAVSMAAAQPIKAPAVITSPGVYELSEDARGITDIYGIQVQCSNVVIDGAGHFLGGEEREKSVGVYVNQYAGSITNITVKNLNLEDWENGIDYKYVKGQEGDTNLITDCELVKCNVGLHIEYSDYINVKDNQIRECSTGVVIEELSTHTDLKKNTIKGCGLGVGITGSMQTTLEENNINSCNIYGVEVVDSEDSIAKKNAISDNKYAAMRFETSKNSTIIGNTLTKTDTGAVLIIGNDVHQAEITDNYFSSFENIAVDDVSTDIVWNITQTPGVNILGGPYLGGNYWGSAIGSKGFSDTASDKDGYGIADEPFRINDYNIDYLPLTHTTATKAPEEQIGAHDADNSAEVADNATYVTEINPVTSPSATSNPVSSPTVALSSVQTTQETPVKDVNDSSLSTPKVIDVTSTITPVQTHGTNESILNRSVANAYPTEGTEILGQTSDLSPIQIAISSDQMTPVPYTNTSGQPAAGNSQVSTKPAPENQTSTGGKEGYLVFVVSEPGGTVMLITATGFEIKLDPMQQNTLTVPVPTDRHEYASYRIEKNGYTPASGEISPYPGSGQTSIITVTLNRTIPNSTVLSLVQPVQNTSVPSGNTTHLSGQPTNHTNSSSTPLILSGPSSPNGSVTIAAVPAVLNASVTPIVVSNGVHLNSAGTHDIRASAGPGGSISPEGAVSIEDKSAGAFMIQADAGHKISYLVVDGIQTSPMSEYRFMNVTSNHTIVAGFT